MSERRTTRCIATVRDHRPGRVATSVAAGILLMAAAVVVPLIGAASEADAATDAVTTCAGSGPGSLPAVVTAAASGDTVSFSVSCPSSSPITVASTIAITKNLSITGAGPSTAVVSGGGTVRVFSVGAGVTVTLSGLTIEDGLGPPSTGTCLCQGSAGGGVDNLGTLTMTNDTVTGNATSDGADDVTSDNGLGAYSGAGGGIYNGGTLTVTDTTVSHNATGNGGDGGDNVKNGGSGGTAGAGGGIANGGTLTMSSDTVTDNTTGNGGAGGNDDGPDGGDGGYAGSGGGIDNAYVLSLTDVAVTGNSTGTAGAGGANDQSGGTAGSPGVGGGIDNGVSAGVTGSTISDNSAAGGGGIASASDLGLSDSTVTDNSAGPLGGGGVRLESDATISDSTFTANTTTGAGGGIDAAAAYDVTVTGTTLVGNGAQSGGDLEVGDDTTVGSTLLAEATSGDDCGPFQPGGGTDTIADDPSCFTGATDIIDADLAPTLGSLAANGGPTETMALEPGSPAIGLVADPSLCTGPDQRGAPRPTPCDAGAYETATGVMAQTITFTSPAPTDAVVNGPTYTVTATGGASGNPVTFSIEGLSGAIKACSVSGSTVTFVGVGTCVINANQYGGTDTAAAPQVQQSFSVGEGTPSFISADTVSATVGRDFDFLVATTGLPIPVITHKGKWPRGVGLRPQNNGSSHLGGKPGKAGTYPVVLKAVFGTGPSKIVVTQNFTLTVSPRHS